MNEGLLHEMARKAGGRFKLTSLVQKRLVELMIKGDDIIRRNCGGRPVRLAVEQIAVDTLGLRLPKEIPAEATGAAIAAVAPEKEK